MTKPCEVKSADEANRLLDHSGILHNGDGISAEQDFPPNPNWARRIQDIKEFGYTLATHTNMSIKGTTSNGTHILLLPLPKEGVTGYENKTESCIRAIDEMYSLCTVDNWDDSNEKAISQTSVKFAKQFVKQLSLEYEFPEPAPEPTGNMGLEWIVNKYRLGLSIDENSIITYAVITPKGKSCGTIKFEGQIPEEIKIYLDKMIEEE